MIGLGLGLPQALRGLSDIVRTIVRTIFADASPGLSILIEEAIRANVSAGVWGVTSGWTAGQLAACRAFQDSAGTIPVYAMEQPLGLVLDNSQGLVRGPELWGRSSNIPMSAALTALEAGWVRVSATGAAAGARQNFGAVVIRQGEAFAVDFEWRGNTAAKPITVFVGGGYLVTTSAVAGRVTGIVISSAVSQSLQVYMATATSGDVFEFLVNTVKHIPGNHLIQPSNTASRPVVSRRVNLLPQSASVTPVNISSSWLHYYDNVRTYQAGNTFVFGTNAADRVLSNGITLAANDPITASVVLSGTGTVRLFVLDGGGAARAAVEIPLTATPTRYSTSASGVVVNGGSNGGIGIYNSAVTPGATVTITDPQVEIGLSPTAYQAVRSATDYDQVGFPAKAVRDGVDDWTESPTINPAGATDVTLVMSVQQLQALGSSAVLFEYGPNSSTTVGSFGLFGPGNSGASQLTAVVRGTSTPSTQIVSGTPLAVGSKAVVSLMFSLTTGRLRIRINGTQVLDVVTSATGGAFSSQKAYIGRRAGSSLPSKASTFGATLVFKALPDAQIAALEAKHRTNGKIY